MNERLALIEASLPLDAIARDVARESAVSPLHLWWSHKPAPACRAVLFASLVDDPGRGLPDEEAASERAKLSDLVARLSGGENAALQEARTRLLEAYPDGLPTVFDPFCGSGAIPCEAQRLGLPVFASDLNPVAVLGTAALIDFPVRFAAVAAVHPDVTGPALSLLPSGPTSTFGLAEDVRFYGRVVRDEAERRIGQLYPPVVTGEPVIAWIWCRTARCPNPACGAAMPLVHSFWLSTRQGKEAWVYPEVNAATGAIRFLLGPGDGVPEPPPGTYSRSGAYCIACRQPVRLDVLRQQGRDHGLGTRLLAIVAKARRGRRYLPPDAEQEALASRAAPSWAPESELAERALGISVPQYGLRRHRDLFTSRQLTALAAFSDAVRIVRGRVEADARTLGLAADGVRLTEGGRGATAYADAICTYLALALDRAAAKWCSLARWQRSRENIEHPFASPGLQMTWDFAEANPFSPATGNWLDAVDAVAGALERAPREGPPPTCRQMDAAAPQDLPDGGLVVCTDPPYFANLPYADTSDLFYVWLRHNLAEIFPDLLRTVLTPKEEELVADPHRYGGRAAARQRFLDGMQSALVHLRTRVRPDLPLTFYYALRQSRPGDADDDEPGGAEGWATMLESLLAAGLRITGTWPLRTEHTGRRRSLGSNALASTILLVCRPRAADAQEASLREVLRGLHRELPGAVAALTAAGIAPVDLAQAAIGPGMAIFSRYSRVLAADGTPVSVAAALRLINQELDAVLAEGDADLDAESRFCVAWFEQFGLEARPYGDADVLARAKNTGIEPLARLGLVEARAGKVRLLTGIDGAGGANSVVRSGCTWLILQHLIAVLQRDGETGAGELLRQVPVQVASALRPLAYRVYSIAERLALGDEARSYGALVSSWDSIEVQARRRSRALQLPGL